MAGVRQRDLSCLHIADSDENRREVPVGLHVELAGAHLEGGVREVALEQVGPNGEAQPRHDRRGVDPPPRDVADDESEVPVVEQHDAVPIAADVDAAHPGDVARCDLQVGDRRVALRKKCVLERLRDRSLLAVERVHLLVEPRDRSRVLLGGLSARHELLCDQCRSERQQDAADEEDPGEISTQRSSERAFCARHERQGGIPEGNRVADRVALERERARRNIGRCEVGPAYLRAQVGGEVDVGERRVAFHRNTAVGGNRTFGVDRKARGAGRVATAYPILWRRPFGMPITTTVPLRDACLTKRRAAEEEGASAEGLPIEATGCGTPLLSLQSEAETNSRREPVYDDMNRLNCIALPLVTQAVCSAVWSGLSIPRIASPTAVPAWRV